VEQSRQQDLDERGRGMLDLLGKPEDPNSEPVPLREFNRRTLEIADTANLTSTIRVWELDLRQRTPDLRAIRRFLNVRYRHDHDDIEHDDPFAERVPSYL
jgi:hypothetical protein